MEEAARLNKLYILEKNSVKSINLSPICNMHCCNSRISALSFFMRFAVSYQNDRHFRSIQGLFKHGTFDGLSLK
jgi:hypothetical protein